MRQKLEKLFNIPSEENNISEPISIDHMGDLFPHEVSRAISQHYPSYRSVKQDGNSFYRICAFHYLAHAELYSYETAFPLADLQECHDLTLPKIDGKQLLNFIWHRYLRVMAGSCSIERQKKLVGLFNNSQLFDETMVAYMRARNGDMIRKLEEELEDYANVGLEMRRAYTIGQQTQDLERYTAARMLQSKIKIFQYSENGLVQNQILFGGYSIPFIKEGNNFNLLVSNRDCIRLKKATLTNNQELKAHPIHMDEDIYQDDDILFEWEIKKIEISDFKKQEVEPVKIQKERKLDFQSFQQFSDTRKEQIITLKKEKLPQITTLQDLKSSSSTKSEQAQIVQPTEKRVKLIPRHRKYPTASSSRRTRDIVIFLVLLVLTTTIVILV